MLCLAIPRIEPMAIISSTLSEKDAQIEVAAMDTAHVGGTTMELDRTSNLLLSL